MYGLLIELFPQISCLANSETNSITNKPQFDVRGHARNETEVIKCRTKLNLSNNLYDEIELLESKSNTSSHDESKFNKTLANVGNLGQFLDAGTDDDNIDQEQAESHKLVYESDNPVLPEEYMFKNGKKVLVADLFEETDYYFYGAKPERQFDQQYIDDELTVGEPAQKDLVTWVNRKYEYNYEPEVEHVRTKIIKKCPFY